MSRTTDAILKAQDTPWLLTEAEQQFTQTGRDGRPLGLSDGHAIRRRQILDRGVPRDLEPLLDALISECYTTPAIERILAHAARHGSIECSPDVADEDRRLFEALLPRSPLWQSGEWDAIGTGDGPGEGF